MSFKLIQWHFWSDMQHISKTPRLIPWTYFGDHSVRVAHEQQVERFLFVSRRVNGQVLQMDILIRVLEQSHLTVTKYNGKFPYVAIAQRMARRIIHHRSLQNPIFGYILWNIFTYFSTQICRINSLSRTRTKLSQVWMIWTDEKIIQSTLDYPPLSPSATNPTGPVFNAFTLD